MSLIARLKNLQQTAEPVIPDMSDQTIESLENLTIEFGQKHKGKKYHEAWTDQEWVQFMVTRYSKSSNPDHQRFLKYVELMIVFHEESQLPITMNPIADRGIVTGHPTVHGHPVPKAKAKAKGQARTMGYNVHMQVPNHLPDLDPADSEWENHSMMYQTEFIPENLVSQSPGFQAMSQRLLHMENALQRVIGHLEHQAQGHQPDSRGDSTLNNHPDDAEVFTQVHVDQQKVWRLIRTFQKELDEAVHDIQPMGKQYDLAEVFCSSSSMLTHQVQQLGGTAFRIGLEQGDLSTTEGRLGLFRKLVMHRPRHVWVSPVCGPWSSWSRLNESRSMEHQQKYQHEREDLLYQIALIIVLYRHQIAKGRHIHVEQPQKSLLVHQPSLAEIYQHTQVAEFDLCRMGDLRCPKTGLPMKKGMQVITTYEHMFQILHGKRCHHDHEHQPIEGTVNTKYGPILRSKYTEKLHQKVCQDPCQGYHKGRSCLAIPVAHRPDGGSFSAD